MASWSQASNALAIESAPGVWEVLQAGTAELIAPRRYQLSRLLRGQRGTEGAMGNPAPRARGSWCLTRRSPCCHVEQPWRGPRSPGDLTIRWIRRSRVLAAESWTGLEVPLGEESKAYEVEIMDGTVVRRVLANATTSVVYTSAQQTADFGTLLGPGDTLDLRIFQLSALVGRGAAKTVTLTF